MSKKSKTGIEGIAEALDLMSPEERSKILKNVAARDPEIAKKIEDQVYSFSLLISLDEKEIQALLQKVNILLLATALRKPPEGFKEAWYAKLPKRMVSRIEEEVETLGPQKLSDVRHAQKEIMKIAKNLDQEGKICLKK